MRNIEEKLDAEADAGAAVLVRVAVPVPLAESFDYAWEGPGPPPPVGARVRVPFGRRERIGIVLEHPATSSVAPERLKPVGEALDSEAVVGAELLGSLRWAANYYHHPIGEVLKHALPGLMRRARRLEPRAERAWRLAPAAGAQSAEGLAKSAPRQAHALRLLAEAGELTAGQLGQAGIRADTLRRLAAKDLIVASLREPGQAHSAGAGGRPVRADGRPAGAREPEPPGMPEPPALTGAQREAVEAVRSHGAAFGAFLLYGVTGSGKTEVFLRLIAEALHAGRQTLLLVPEIGLTPQLVERLRERFGGALAVLHSGLPDTERFEAWRRAHEARVRVILGTRSAVFAPLPVPGLIIVDEEHDPSYKQQTGFRYSARDLAVLRARRLSVPVVLASATPSLESFHNALARRYRLLHLPERIGTAGTPAIRLVDLNRHASSQGLSTPLVSAMNAHLASGNQVLLFLNRRGFAPVLFCTECREAEPCERCDARLTVHARAGRLRCHHCGAEKPLHWACPQCGAERIGVGAGTQRVADQLRSLYPERRIARLDRDTAGQEGRLAAMLGDVARGDTDIIVGTQMLTKGHDFPRVTLVGILNADQGLFGTDFRSNERLAQTLVQVAGRAGRRERPGEVIVQTHYPQHPLLVSLIEQDYSAFARLALEERRGAAWPPFSHLAVWRAEATERARVFEFLLKLRRRAEAEAGAGGAAILGPAPDPMERRGGRYRAQLLFQHGERAPLHGLVERVLAAAREWREARRVRWAVDVDPIEL